MSLLILKCRSTPAGRRYQLLQRQAEQLQEDFYRSETGRKGLQYAVINPFTVYFFGHNVNWTSIFINAR